MTLQYLFDDQPEGQGLGNQQYLRLNGPDWGPEPSAFEEPEDRQAQVLFMSAGHVEAKSCKNGGPSTKGGVYLEHYRDSDATILVIKFVRLVDFTRDGITHNGVAAFVRKAKIAHLLPRTHGQTKLFEDDLTTKIPVSWTPIFVSLTDNNVESELGSQGIWGDLIKVKLWVNLIPVTRLVEMGRWKEDSGKGESTASKEVGPQESPAEKRGSRERKKYFIIYF